MLKSLRKAGRIICDKFTGLEEELEDNLAAAMTLSSLPDSYRTLITGLESIPNKRLQSVSLKEN